MTTIVYKDGILAADSQVGDDNTRVGYTNKIYVEQNHVIGFCGILSLKQLVFQYFIAKNQRLF